MLPPLRSPPPPRASTTTRYGLPEMASSMLEQLREQSAKKQQPGSSTHKGKVQPLL